MDVNFLAATAKSNYDLTIEAVERYVATEPGVSYIDTYDAVVMIAAQTQWNAPALVRRLSAAGVPPSALVQAWARYWTGHRRT